VLEEEDLGRARLVGEPRLRLLAFLPAKRRIHHHDIEQRGRALEETAVGLLPGQGVAMPQIRLVDPVQDQVREPDRVDQVLLLAAEERAASAPARTAAPRRSWSAA